MIAHLGTLDFVVGRENVVFLGPGTSKSHLAIGLAVRACQAGHRTLFATAAGWIARLAEAHAAGRLQLAALGYAVTALDLSPRMLAKLRDAAGQWGLDVTLVEGSAEVPPDGPFDVVTERHLLWVLTDAATALRAWRRVAPEGRVVAFEGLWGNADPGQQRLQHGREVVRRLRRRPAPHHAEFAEGLPFEHGMHPDAVCEAVQRAGWPAPRLERLHDVEWARMLSMPPAERLLGTTPQFVVAADSPQVGASTEASARARGPGTPVATGRH